MEWIVAMLKTTRGKLSTQRAVDLSSPTYASAVAATSSSIGSGSRSDPAAPLSERLRKYATSHFLYTTELVRNTLLLHDEYLREDFYSLRFRLPEDVRTKYCSLKLTDLTGKKYSEILFTKLRVDHEGYVFFDPVAQNTFNPRKKLPWVRQLEDLVGNVYRVELASGGVSLLVKYVCFDYFSYQNYLTVTLPLIQSSRCSRKSRTTRR